MDVVEEAKTELVNMIKKQYGDNAWWEYEVAYNKANELHKDQKRFSGAPYIIHPIHVACTLAELGMDTATIKAGLLHDTVEDTPYTKEQLKNDFGTEVASLVEAVTKIDKYEYSSKVERQAENWRKMLVATANDVRVIVIKLADRLDNLRTLEFMTSEKQRNKAYETLEIYAPLAHRLGMFKIKWELEDLSLKYIDPVAYNDISKKVAQKRAEREKYVQSLIDTLQEKLKSAGIEADVQGRPKSFYSIYRKMYLQNKEFGQIYDLIALRVIVKTKLECYIVMAMVHELWKPIFNRFKDYINSPKPNNYQSLHTTVIDENGETFEVQIRTEEMHRIAEYGVAAHWKYKEGTTGEKDSSFDALMVKLRSLLEWQAEDHDAEDFINAVKQDLVVDEVLVFTPKGDIKNLPKGSTPIDFAYSIHSEVGNTCVSAQVNGKLVPLNYVLQTGDIVGIRTSPNAKPSRDWLNIIKSTQAREKIKQYFKKTNREENIARGKDMLEKSAVRQGYNLSALMRKEWLNAVMNKHGYKTVDDLYAAIGYGGITTNKVLFKLIEKFKEELQKKPEIGQDAYVEIVNKKKNTMSKGVILPGVDNVLIHLAPCCMPVPGDDIVGYVTQGKGVSVHRMDCKNVKKYIDEDYHTLDVKWDKSYSGIYQAKVDVCVHDTANINKASADVVLTLSDMNMELVSVTTEKNKGIVHVTVNVKNKEQLAGFMNKVRSKPGIGDVYRK